MMKFLSLAAGENPSTSDLIILNVTAIVSMIVIVAYSWTELQSYLQLVVLALLTYDVIGGAMSNLTQSTNDYYVKQGLRTKFIFISIHFMQPLLAVVFLTDYDWTLFVVLTTYTLVTSTIVSCLNSGSDLQKQCGVGFYLVGVVLYSCALNPPLPLKWFGYVFMFKLIYGFSVDHNGKSAVKGIN